jgi:hypothetical protein
MKLGVVALALGLGGSGCAAGQLALHAEPTCPVPEKERCTPGATNPPRLTVRVVDEAGAETGGVSVYLGRMAVPPATLTTQTDRGVSPCSKLRARTCTC